MVEMVVIAVIAHNNKARYLFVKSKTIKTLNANRSQLVKRLITKNIVLKLLRLSPESVLERPWDRVVGSQRECRGF